MVPYWRNMLAMVWSDLGESYLWACWAIGKMQLPYRSTSLWKSPHLKLYPMRKFILTEKKCVLSLWYHSVKTRWLWSCYTEQLDRCIYLYKQQCHVVYKVILYIGFFLSCECNSYLLLKKNITVSTMFVLCPPWALIKSQTTWATCVCCIDYVGDMLK